jgi:acetyl esterase/lipase
MSKAQRRAVDEAARRGPQGFEAVSVERMRAGFASMMSAFPVPDGIEQTAVTLGGRPAVRVTGTAAKAGTILYFHGGSFSLGSPQTAMAHTAQLVLRSGVPAISLDYRLAPEHPFPAAIEDCLAAYRELLDNGSTSDSIVFAGDSAGGGLAVTTCLAARDAGLPLPAGIVAFSPGLDHTRSGATMTTREAADPYFSRESLAYTAEMYLAGQDPDQPLLAPAVHADLTGFPPLLLQVGTNEVLLDDAVRLATRAVDADVDVVLDVTAGVPHVFQSYVDVLDEAGQALDRAALFIVQRLS